jgi:hypothetical protein
MKSVKRNSTLKPILLSTVMSILSVSLAACGNDAAPTPPTVMPGSVAATEPCSPQLTTDWNTLARGAETLRLQAADFDKALADKNNQPDDLLRQAEGLRDTNADLQTLAQAFESNYAGISCSAIQEGKQVRINPDQGTEVLDKLQKTDQNVQQEEDQLRDEQHQPSAPAAGPGKHDAPQVSFEKQVSTTQAALLGT